MVADITVVGGGFIGLSFSMAAAQQGFSVEVYDRKSRPAEPGTFSSNVLAINSASRAFLASIGAWDSIPDRFRAAYKAMSVVDGSGTGSVRFTAEEAGLPELGCIVDQPALLAALADCAESADNLVVHWQSEVDIDVGVSPLVVGADGVHSALREKLGLKKISFAYGQTATVCVAEVERPHDACARQWFLEKGPLAFLPLGDEHRVAVVWSSFDELEDLDEDVFIDALYEASEGALGAIVGIGKRFGFPLRQQQALQYVAEGVALMGDAAHAIHPLAGQGANLGFADARVLSDELIAARIEGRSPGNLTVLKRYERVRRPENHLTALAMEGFHRLFTARPPWASVLRGQGMHFFGSSEILKRLAIGAASGR